jgi:transcriptional regulator with XRE-family HTH domain
LLSTNLNDKAFSLQTKEKSMTEKLDPKERAGHKKNTVAERIKYIRGSLTQIEFSGKLGIGRNTIQQWEVNKGFPGFESLLKLHKIFNVDINWLISGEGKPYLKSLKNHSDIENRIAKMESRIAALEKGTQWPKS